MKDTSGEPMDPLEPLEIGRCCELLGPPTSEALERGLEGFLARVHARKAHRRWGWQRWSLVGAAAALAVLMVVQASSALRRHWQGGEATLAYRIEGGNEVGSGYLRESSLDGVRVLFSEGSRFELASGARGRIRTVGREGAHLAVERGSASLHITPDTARRWMLDVGPFSVTVKGTVFTVSWDPSSEQFELALQRGQVVVNGPVLTGEIALRAGQRLAVSLGKSESIISEDLQQPARATFDGVPASAPLPDESPSMEHPEPTAPRESAPPAPSNAEKAAADHQWRALLARGNWGRILADVRHLGINQTLNKASSEDLFALANAARYHQQFDLARAALLAERRRFPASPRALDALYLLGRVEESREAGSAQAIAWYDEYLDHAPSGPLVGEALGRKMILTEKVDGPTRARRVAEDYLRRFPKGHYAGSARELLAVP